MKRILFTVLIGLFVLGFTSTAKAVTLNPGTAPLLTTPGTAPSLVGFQATTGLITFSNNLYSGTFQEDVYQNATGMLFVYSFSNDASTQLKDSLSRLTAIDFTGFNTSADAYDSGGLHFPHYVDRSSSGSTIGFQFRSDTDGGVAPGESSAVLWIQTDAQYYTPGEVTLQNGHVETLRGFGPTIPEPSSLMLLGMGILGLFGLGRKKI